MALKAGGQHYCRFVHRENGKVIPRRIHVMTVQAADGRVHHLQGEKLPDSLTLQTGESYRGAHLADVLLSPETAKAAPLLPADSGWLTRRDAFFIVLGMFFFRLIYLLADGAVHALN